MRAGEGTLIVVMDIRNSVLNFNQYHDACKWNTSVSIHVELSTDQDGSYGTMTEINLEHGMYRMQITE